jgi:hypothetical protein
MYEVDECHFVEDLPSVLKELGCTCVLTLDGVNTDSRARHSGADFPGKENFNENKTLLFPALQKCRKIKVSKGEEILLTARQSQKEIEVMRYVCKASAEAHKEVMKQVCCFLRSL